MIGMILNRIINMSNDELLKDILIIIGLFIADKRSNNKK
jgi:hypothetical protein